MYGDYLDQPCHEMCLNLCKTTYRQNKGLTISFLAQIFMIRVILKKGRFLQEGLFQK